MDVVNTLADSLQEVLLDGTWVTGTNIRNEIIDLDWKTATKNVDTLNSIADLTSHLNYYLAGVLQVLRGGNLEIRDMYSFDYDPIQSAEAWQQLVNTFCYNAEQFISAVEQLSPTILEHNFVKPEYGSYFRNLTVMSEHCYYHLGQMVLIKKMIHKQGL